MLAKINIPANSEVGLVTAMIEAARGDGKEERNLDSGASFHMSLIQAGMTAYEKAPAETIVEVADGTIWPVDGFGTVEVDLDQPGTTSKRVKMFSVAYVPGRSRDFLSTHKAVEQWGKPLVYLKTKDVLRFRGRSRLFLISAPARDCFP